MQIRASHSHRRVLDLLGEETASEMPPEGDMAAGNLSHESKTEETLLPVFKLLDQTVPEAAQS